MDTHGAKHSCTKLLAMFQPNTAGLLPVVEATGTSGNGSHGRLKMASNFLTIWRDGVYILSHESGQTSWLLWTIEFARSDAVQVSEPSPYKIRSIQVLSLGTLSVRKPEAR